MRRRLEHLSLIPTDLSPVIQVYLRNRSGSDSWQALVKQMCAQLRITDLLWDGEDEPKQELVDQLALALVQSAKQSEAEEATRRAQEAAAIDTCTSKLDAILSLA